jgi:hypothetical protein
VKEKAMEAILGDAKRFMRSILGNLHAIFGAVRSSKSGAAGRQGKAGYRMIGEDRVLIDIYGRRGIADLYADRETFSLFRVTASRRDEIF